MTDPLKDPYTRAVAAFLNYVHISAPTRYLINFLLDASLGMLFIYAGVRVVSAVVEWRQWESLRFGEYGESYFCWACKSAVNV